MHQLTDVHCLNNSVKPLQQVKDRIGKYDTFLKNNIKELNAKGMYKQANPSEVANASSRQ